jgi:hypothetical protein
MKNGKRITGGCRGKEGENVEMDGKSRESELEGK